MIPRDSVVLEATYRPAGPELEVTFRAADKRGDLGELEQLTLTGEEARRAARELFPAARPPAAVPPAQASGS